MKRADKVTDEVWATLHKTKDKVKVDLASLRNISQMV
jgi:hypothetical protein